MNGITRGARLWVLREREPVPAVVLDRGPDGWWMALEGLTDSAGRPIVEQHGSRNIYPSKKTAAGG